MIFWSSLSLIGLFVVHRTLIQCETLQIFSTSTLHRVRMFSFLTLLTLNYLLREQIALLIALNIVIILSPWWVPYAIEKQRESSLKKEFIPILDGVILSMKSGRGFRPSLALCLQNANGPARHSLNEFLSALQYQKEIQSLSSDPKIRFFFSELTQVDLSSIKPVDKLKALRRRLMIEKNFRQKSRQALLQVRFQSWIISAMYVLVLLYIQHDFGIQKNLGLVLTSGFLFMTGLIVVQRMGRAYKWKI